MKYYNSLLKRGWIILLASIISLAFMPVMTGVSVFASDDEYYEGGDTIEESVEIGLNFQSGFVTNYDEDWYQITIPRDGSYRLGASYYSDDEYGEITIRIYDQNNSLKYAIYPGYYTDYSDSVVLPSLKKGAVYYLRVTGDCDDEALYKMRLDYIKKANTLKAQAHSATVKYSKLKRKNQVIERKAVISVAKPQGTVSYSKVSGNKKIYVAPKSGKFTVKKGLKKGTYRVKVKVTAAGGKWYKKGTKTVVVTVKVK